MNVNRRKFLQSAAAVSVGASAFATRALSEEPITVVGIHDLSGGLDIYGKPMVDALTFAVEEANAAGGLLGRQIKLINCYSPRSASPQLRQPLSGATFLPRNAT